MKSEQKARGYTGTQEMDLKTLEMLYRQVRSSDDKEWIGFLIANKRRLR